jgi:hypothetical protein
VPDSSFLETYPLYRKMKVEIPPTVDNLSKPPISMNCGKCAQLRTFVMTNEYYNGFAYKNSQSAGETVKASYLCTYCQSFQINFFIQLSDDRKSMCKAGQFPPWTLAGDENITGMLGEHKDYLKKGLICESQSYGVAAFAYYRRIVEQIIDALILDIGELMSPEESAKYNEALEAVKATRVTAEKIDLVKDMLPAILRPDNMNPLSLLHGVLSEGLHADSDERCLELAVEVREILTFLAAQVAASKIASRNFNVRMRSLLDKREKSVTTPTDQRPQLG